MENVTASQITELAMGIEASGQEFIWVVRKRKDEQENDDWLPEGCEERTKEDRLIIRGCAPQVVILDHEAVWAFVTHCGWNSTLDGISAGVPMITWPMFAEQFFNEKLVTEVLRTGTAVGSMQYSRSAGEEVKREAIAKVIKRAMVGEKIEKFKNRGKNLKEMTKYAIGEGGSSYIALTTLFQNISAYNPP